MEGGGGRGRGREREGRGEGEGRGREGEGGGEGEGEGEGGGTPHLGFSKKRGSPVSYWYLSDYVTLLSHPPTLTKA